MNSNIFSLICALTVSSLHAQYAAWPATSYSPFFEALFGLASKPVATLLSGPGMQAPSIPLQAPMPYAFPVAAPALPFGAAPLALAGPPPPLYSPPSFVPAVLREKVRRAPASSSNAESTYGSSKKGAFFIEDALPLTKLSLLDKKRPWKAIGALEQEFQNTV